MSQRKVKKKSPRVTKVTHLGMEMEICQRGGEWQVRVKGDPEATIYCESFKHAVATAPRMAQHRAEGHIDHLCNSCLEKKLGAMMRAAIIHACTVRQISEEDLQVIKEGIDPEIVLWTASSSDPQNIFDLMQSHFTSHWSDLSTPQREMALDIAHRIQNDMEGNDESMLSILVHNAVARRSTYDEEAGEVREIDVEDEGEARARFREEAYKLYGDQVALFAIVARDGDGQTKLEDLMRVIRSEAGEGLAIEAHVDEDATFKRDAQRELHKLGPAASQDDRIKGMHELITKYVRDRSDQLLEFGCQEIADYELEMEVDAPAA